MSMDLIQTKTLLTDTAAFDFTLIPNTFTDLVITLNARNASTVGDVRLQFNGDTGSNYVFQRLYGNGSTTAAGSGTQTSLLLGTIANTNTYTSNTFSTATIYICNYLTSNAKAISVEGANENNATAATATILAGRWTGTAAINRAYVYADSGSFSAGSTVSLFGILKGSGGATVS